MRIRVRARESEHKANIDLVLRCIVDVYVVVKEDPPTARVHQLRERLQHILRAVNRLCGSASYYRVAIRLASIHPEGIPVPGGLADNVAGGVGGVYADNELVQGSGGGGGWLLAVLCFEVDNGGVAVHDAAQDAVLA